MLRNPLMPPRRILMTLDAVGGVWRYAVDLAGSLTGQGITCVLVGFGPEPDERQIAEVEAMPGVSLVWARGELDWMAERESDLDLVRDELIRLADEWQPDLLHLNLPSQAVGLPDHLQVVVASHSCIATWWEAVRGSDLPDAWHWQKQRNQRGFTRARIVLSPSRSHAQALQQAYGEMPPIAIVHNASASAEGAQTREPVILAAGRWWDEGKNARTLDAAADGSPWPLIMAGPCVGPNGQSIMLRHAVARGPAPADELRQLMRRAAVFASSSCYEPFGLAVLEAAQRGAALVLADIPTFRELWDGAALFVAADKPEAYRQAFQRLADDDGLRASLAAKARHRALNFTPDRQLDALLRSYAQSQLDISVPTAMAS